MDEFPDIEKLMAFRDVCGEALFGHAERGAMEDVAQFLNELGYPLSLSEVKDLTSEALFSRLLDELATKELRDQCYLAFSKELEGAEKVRFFKPAPHRPDPIQC